MEALKRVNRDQFPMSMTFFSRVDTWQYVEVIDTRTCDVCRGYAEAGPYMGAMLRSLFPYLEIEDVDIIMVNVHDHCRCYSFFA